MPKGITMSDTAHNNNYSGMTILCVDDERIILRTLTRLFYKKKYNTLTAGSGKQALEVLEKNKVDLIVSDMRMPEMDGASLLEIVANTHPDTYRIVLSGYSDFESTVAAINLGKIHRFVNKPWDNDELVNAVEKGLELIYLTKENKRLKEQVVAQNDLLKQANIELEDKVSQRTKQIRASLLKNERNNRDCEKMLFNFISINPNLSGTLAKKIAQLSVRLGKELNISKDDLFDIRLAAYLNEIGLLGLAPNFCKTPYRLLNYDEKTIFLNQVNITQQILSPAQRLNRVKEILTHQFLTLKEIHELTDSKTLLACKILIIARDYWRFSYGNINSKKMQQSEVFLELNKSRGIKYDEGILDILIAKPDLVSDAVNKKGITSLKLLPKMILKESLFSSQSLLILVEGHEFSESSIKKLIEYEKNQKQKFLIVVE